MRLVIITQQRRHWREIKDQLAFIQQNWVDLEFFELIENLNRDLEFLVYQERPRDCYLFLDCRGLLGESLMSCFLKLIDLDLLERTVILHHSPRILQLIYVHSLTCQDCIITGLGNDTLKHLKNIFYDLLLKHDPKMSKLADLDLNQINYFKHLRGSHYVEIHCINGEKEYVRSTLTHFDYLRPRVEYVQRDTLVNCSNIEKIDQSKKILSLKNQENVKLSPSRMKAVLNSEWLDCFIA